MRQYCERYGDTIYSVSSDFGPVPKWEGETAERIVREMNQVRCVTVSIYRQSQTTSSSVYVQE